WVVSNRARGRQQCSKPVSPSRGLAGLAARGFVRRAFFRQWKAAPNPARQTSLAALDGSAAACWLAFGREPATAFYPFPPSNVSTTSPPTGPWESYSMFEHIPNARTDYGVQPPHPEELWGPIAHVRTSEADARLIAAAPELLGVLRVAHLFLAAVPRD